eukprot:Skav205216  [mRNA]  locus=scaffold400:107012:120315:- [translate_table: standard]
MAVVPAAAAADPVPFPRGSFILISRPPSWDEVWIAGYVNGTSDVLGRTTLPDGSDWCWVVIRLVAMAVKPPVVRADGTRVAPAGINGAAVNWIYVPPDCNQFWDVDPVEVISLTQEANLILSQLSSSLDGVTINTAGVGGDLIPLVHLGPQGAMGPGGHAHGGFNSFLLRALAALRVGEGLREDGGFMSVVEEHFSWLGDEACMDRLDSPLKGGRGAAPDQVYPLPPLSVDGKILRLSACASSDDRLLWHSGNLVIAVLNWLHGESKRSTRDVGILSAAHRRVHARIVRTLRESVMTDDPILSRGGLNTFLKEAELYKGSGVVLPLGMRGGVPDHAADVPLAEHLEHFAPQVAAQIRDPKMLLLPTSYAKLGLDDPEVIRSIESASAKKLQSFSEQDLSTTLWAFGTMLHRDDEFLDSWIQVVSTKFLRDSKLKHLKPQHASNILWALASMIFYDAPFFTALSGGIQRSIQGFAPQDLACSIWACATVVHRDPSLTDLVAQQAAQQLRHFDEQSVGNLLWGVSYLRTSVMNLYEALSSILDDSTVCCYNEKVLAMIIRALMTEELEDGAWQLFQQLQRLDLNPGISAVSLYLHRCHLQPSLEREMQVMSALARFQPCRYVQQAILNAAALRLSEAGFLGDAIQLLDSLLEVDHRNVVGQQLREKLAVGHFQPAMTAGCLNVKWRIPPCTLGHTGLDYDKQCRLLEHVLCTAQQGDAWSVVDTIERFSTDGNGWLKIAGGGKGVVLDDLVNKCAPQPPKLILEFGCFVGYSSTRMAYWLRQHGGKLVSVEVDPVHVCIARTLDERTVLTQLGARNVHEFAGVADVISVCTGYSEDVIPHLKTSMGLGVAADAIFFDQRGTRFHTDLWMLEAEGFLKDGSAVLADNVLKPGAPHFLWYLQHSQKYELTVVSLREFAADRIEDWMALGLYKAAEDFIVPAPKSLDRLAFLTDKARARSCNADGPCEVDEDAWARHAQEIRQAYDEVGIHPRIAHILQSADGKPFVDWTGEFRKKKCSQRRR